MLFTEITIASMSLVDAMQHLAGPAQSDPRARALASQLGLDLTKFEFPPRPGTACLH